MNAPVSGLKRDLFIGIDGGGTSCHARITDSSSRVLGAGSAGPAAVRLGIDRSMAAVEAAARAAAANAGLSSEAMAQMDACIGLAGICRKGAMEELLRRPHPFRSVAYASDATIACVGAHRGRDGGIVIIGTGSIGLAVVGGREVRVGGYGFPISDEGSGADLGMQAIRLSLRACDGRFAATPLTRAVMTHFNNDPIEVVAWADRATPTEYATFAPLVMQHAAGGDEAGKRIVEDAARHLDDLVRRLIACGAPRVALLGGLASSMEPWLAPDVRRRHLVLVEGDALDGALHLARRQVMARSS